MNNNYNPYQTNGQQGLPKPTFSGTLGGSDNDNHNKHILSDEDDEQYYPKRQKFTEANNELYNNNGNIQQQYHPQNTYYSQPYMYGNINQNYTQDYRQPYYQSYNISMNNQSQQNYMGYVPQIELQPQQSSIYDETSIVPNNNSLLTSYEDMYSDKKKKKPVKENKKKTPKDAKKKISQPVPIKKETNKKEPKINNIEIDDDDSLPDKTSSKKVNNQDVPLPVKTLQKDEQEDEDETRDDLDDNEDKDKSGVVTVPGTSIALVTDEDIAEWREERKKMWLLKISNRKEQHREAMGIKEEEVSNMGNVLKESKKERQFIQSIQNQVNRFNPKVNLNLKIVQREMMDDNTKLLTFIKELGDAGLLEYELSEKEKNALFGNQDELNKFNNRRNDRFKGKRSNYSNNNNSNNGNNRNYKNYRNRSQQ